MLSERQRKELNDLLTMVGLPKKISRAGVKKILSLMKHDKKFVAGQNRFVLADSIGRVKVVKNVSSTTITQAIKKYM